MLPTFNTGKLNMQNIYTPTHTHTLKLCVFSPTPPLKILIVLMEVDKIKIKLTAEDVSSERYFLDLEKGAVEEHIGKYWSPMIIKRATIDDIKVLMKDLDTNTQHQVNFRYYKHLDSYFLQGHWRMNFIERRMLKAGDEIEIGFFSNQLCFCVLNRAG